MFVNTGSRARRRPTSDRIAPSIRKALVYLGTATNTTTAGYQKIPVDTVEFDTHGIWDDAGLRFFPRRAGIYLIDARVETVLGAGKTLNGLGAYVNGGARIHLMGSEASSRSLAYGGAAALFLDTPDYLELYASALDIRALATGSTQTWISIVGPF